jgi:hypothetical protein
MSSYFVAAAPQGEVAVHDRSRCPPGAFRLDGSIEYLGEFLDAAQAIAVARVRYEHARGCPCCSGAAVQRTALGGGSLQASAHP